TPAQHPPTQPTTSDPTHKPHRQHPASPTSRAISACAPPHHRILTIGLTRGASGREMGLVAGGQSIIPRVDGLDRTLTHRGAGPSGRVRRRDRVDLPQGILDLFTPPGAESGDKSRHLRQRSEIVSESDHLSIADVPEPSEQDVTPRHGLITDP